MIWLDLMYCEMFKAAVIVGGHNEILPWDVGLVIQVAHHVIYATLNVIKSSTVQDEDVTQHRAERCDCDREGALELFQFEAAFLSIAGNRHGEWQWARPDCFIVRVGSN